MLLDQLQQEKFKKYQLIVLTNLSLIGWLLLIIMPDLYHLSIQLIILLGTVTIIGIPHGYFDFLIAKKLFSKHSHWLYKFNYIFINVCTLSYHMVVITGSGAFFISIDGYLSFWARGNRRY